MVVNDFKPRRLDDDDYSAAVRAPKSFQRGPQDGFRRQLWLNMPWRGNIASRMASMSWSWRLARITWRPWRNPRRRARSSVMFKPRQGCYVQVLTPELRPTRQLQVAATDLAASF